MPKYQIFTTFKVDGWVEVDAENLRQAVELAKNNHPGNLVGKEYQPTEVDLQNSYIWIGDGINDWTELDFEDEVI